MPGTVERLIAELEPTGPEARRTQRALWAWADQNRGRYLDACRVLMLTGAGDRFIGVYEHAEAALGDCGVVFDPQTRRWQAALPIWA